MSVTVKSPPDTTTPAEQRQTALKELRQALAEVRRISTDLRGLCRKAASLADALDRAEDNARNGGLGWLELDDAEMADVLRALGG